VPAAPASGFGTPPAVGLEEESCFLEEPDEGLAAVIAGGVACGPATVPVSPPPPSTGPEGAAAMPVPAPPIVISREGPATSASASTGYATVTDDRLQHPADGNWLMYRRTDDGSQRGAGGGTCPTSSVHADAPARRESGRTAAWSTKTALR